MIPFITLESSSYKNTFFPSITWEFCEEINACPTGPYSLLQARLFGLHYADYLRMVRDCYGGKIVGRKGGFLFCVFEEKEKCEKLVKILNKKVKDWKSK